MAVFTNSDIKKRRELLKMTAATLAEMIGRDPTTVYNWESGKCDPDPDSLYQIAEALGDLNIWYDWMRTKYSSYARLHPEGRANDLPGATMTMFAEKPCETRRTARLMTRSSGWIFCGKPRKLKRRFSAS